MTAAEWAEGLACTLKNSGHGPEQITLASVADEAGYERVLDAVRRTAEDAGWQVINLSVEELRRDYRLPERGYLIIKGRSSRLAPEFVSAVAAFQHLVTRDLPVALLVVASPQAIQSLRREPAFGWLSRADAISEGPTR
jgi:hypothetical protein